MALSDTAVRQAKPKEKDYSVRDALGLFLHVGKNGTKAWHFRFTWLGKQARISLGTYPDVSLSAAREQRDKARSLIAAGTDPRQARQTTRSAAVEARQYTFESVANEWHAFKTPRWAQASAKKARLYLDIDLIPTLGKRQIAEVSRAELVAVLRKIEARQAFNVAAKCRQWLNQIFRYALASGLIESNPATDLDVVAAAAPKTKHHPHVSFDVLPDVLKAVDEAKGDVLTKSAILLLVYTVARPGELRAAPWSEFDLDAATWTIPAERMKMRRDHVVPLPTQAVEILKALHLITGSYRLVFAGRNDPNRPMSENTVNKMLGDAGYKGRQTGHGFRHLFSTEMNGRGYNKDWIEKQLAHADEDEIRGTYNHATYLAQRRTMMQDWADSIRV